jgi:hypothetical protein
MSKQSNPPKKKKPRVHSQLEGFELSIDQFGELKSSMPIEKLNKFLDENVPDNKLDDREDIKEVKKVKKKKPKNKA